MSDSKAFSLAPRLAADSVPLHCTPVAELRLLNDSRWPWLMLVPRVADACELHDLPPDVCAELFAEVRSVGAALQSATGCTSINVAALGNVVSQLHVHVVARRPGDPNWPGPVWGFGAPVRRAADALPPFAVEVVDALSNIARR